MRLEPLPPFRFRPGRVYGQAAALVMATVAGGLAASAQRPDQSPPLWRTRTEVVWVFATVTDPQGHPIANLTRDAFRVFDDGVEQPISQFTGERSPVSLGLVIDISESMRGERVEAARTALGSFLRDRLGPSDEAFLLSFNHAPSLVAGWSTPALLSEALAGVDPTGGTAIYDAVSSALPELARRRHQRAALVVISDGADTASDKSLSELRGELRRIDAFVYALAMAGARDRPSSRVNPEALRMLTDENGGYTGLVENPRQLAAETLRIAEELNHQYLIGYASPRPADGRFHTIRVRLKDAGYLIRARRGYVAHK